MNEPVLHSTVYDDSKKHYQVLDALRGVAAIMVVCFHLFEVYSEGDHTRQIINHGYLAVDFFFLLSGFVIGYAYDDRWNKMSLIGFIKRRLIRLHPMIIMGMLIGGILFYFQSSPILFPEISRTPVLKVLLVMLIGFTLIPVPGSLDIRGWGEMHPLNGPAWTLFFEYIGNLLYATFIRKLPDLILAIFVSIAAFALIHLALTNGQGDIVGGWSLGSQQLYTGFIRLLYPFLAGLMLKRISRPGKMKNAFFICSFMIILILSIPRIGGHENLWMNGLYDSLMVIIFFPIVVLIGASGEVKGKYTLMICKLLGNISYPIYIIHYPLIYTYTAWVVDKKKSLSDGWPVGLMVLIIAICIAYACLKFYDIPIRKWLAKKYLNNKTTTI